MLTRTRLVMQLCAALGIIVITVLAVGPSSPAGAALESCRGDPLVVLSDGALVRITTSVSTSASNVSSIEYLLHTPHGVTVKRVIYTGGALSKKEQFHSTDDEALGQYVSDTVVTVKAGSATVTVTTRLKNDIVSVSGLSGQSLSAIVTN